MTGAKNNYHINNSKKTFSKRQEQKITFAAISAKKNFKEKGAKNIFKATTAQETFSKRQVPKNSDMLQKSISKKQTKNSFKATILFQFWDFISNSVAENNF